MKNKISTLALCSLLMMGTLQVMAQLTPQDAVKLMKRGINIGNTMEAPTEGVWGNPPVKEIAFDDYTTAGFNAVRIPITWQGHTGTSVPYSVDGVWMDRVEQVVDWGLKRGLIIIMNAHHEGFIKDNYTTANKARFDSIWTQVSKRMQNKSDKLIFEIINEPNGLTATQVDDLNSRILKIMRKTNPTRIVSYSGNNYSSSGEFIAAKIPTTNINPTKLDPYVMGYYHSYDPYPFGLVGTGTYGTDADVTTTTNQFTTVANYAKSKNIQVMLGEFGSQKLCEYNSRMYCYFTVVDQALKHGIPFFAWDDNGDFPIYYQRTPPTAFNEIKDILIYTYASSPTKMKFGFTSSSDVILSWQNRTSANDDIIIERSSISGTTMVPIATIASNSRQFIDTTVVSGKSYYYRIKTTVSDTLVKSYPIFTGPVKKGTATAITEGNKEKSFKLYPNPASGSITLQSAFTNTDLKVQVFNLSGKLVKSQTVKGETSVIPLDGLVSGTYLFTISTNKVTETQKVLIP